MTDASAAIVSLIGYRGSGKSAVGRELAHRLGWRTIDADTEIERAAGRSIPEIFASDGEPGFRRLERETIVRVIETTTEPVVFSLGGGAILNADTRADLRRVGPVIWLTAATETLARRIASDEQDRPNRPSLTGAGVLTEIETVLTARLPLYQEACTLPIATDDRSVGETTATDDRSVAEIVEEILGHLPVNIVNPQTDSDRKPSETPR